MSKEEKKSLTSIPPLSIYFADKEDFVPSCMHGVPLGRDLNCHLCETQKRYAPPQKDNERTPSENFRTDVCGVLFEIETILIGKNKAYGNSALDPVRIFSKVDAHEQLKVRIDDKLSRIARGNEFIGDDTVNDLIGYLVLYKVALNKEGGLKNEVC